ncbi:MAG: IS4 family transposase [Mariprofundus sp.]|nr:IS4 family transposase [Mariprofundus sp.]
MGKVLRQVAADFEVRYGYRPWLLESFIDTERHTGTCYEASNWIKVGITKGRGRNDVNSKKLESIKAIYLYPLTQKFRKHMGVDEPGPPPTLDIVEGLDHDIWAQNEFGGASLGDARLSKRLVEAAGIQAANPMRSFCGAAKGERAVVKGYYRMIEQPDDSAITMAAILAPHRERTIQRMRNQETILSIQDGTDLNFNSLAQCEGLGVIGKNQTDTSSKGLHMHSSFVVTTDGIPLGVLDVECAARQPKTADSDPEEKTTQSWIKATRNNNKLAKILPNTHQIVTMDREGDFFELFEEPRHSRVDLLVRAKHNRKTDGEFKLFDSIRQSPAQGQLNITIPRQSARPKLSKQKARPKREKRQAIVDLRYQQIKMRAPGTTAHKDKAPIHLWMVHIREVSPPPNEKGVEWFLLATWPITSDAEAQECVRWYSLRWRIEDWHRVLKSGCKIEELAYKTAERLKRGIAINIVIAWRIMLMTLLGRESPELPAEVLFSDLEIKVLKAYAIKKKELLPLMLGNACQIVASMGGYLGRKHDLPPGHQMMWQGYASLQQMCEGFKLAETAYEHNTVGKGQA